MTARRFITDVRAANEAIYDKKGDVYLVRYDEFEDWRYTRKALLDLFDDLHDDYACERMRKDSAEEECRYCALAAQIRGTK